MSLGVKDKVIVITGAGRGIGRAIALLGANEGARVVVNDLGGTPNGSGADAAPAEQVAAEIRATGGEAVANGDNIAAAGGGERIIQTALDVFGRVDCVINNAGILRDRMFHNMTPEEWRDVIDVHLNGYFNVSRAAAPHFKSQNSGSFVHFTSPAGLIGAMGQSNYAAAKMGVVGLSTGIAFDMARFNVRSNCVAPSAWTRLLSGLTARNKEEEERFARLEKSMSPEKIAPLCVFLATDAAAGISGQIFKARGNEIFLMSQPRPIRSVHRDGGWSLQSLEEQMLPAMKSSFVKMENHLDVFSWEPI
ncbi:SDR family NAD(P)-dependent oxidoreductase [Variovorax humicola]|uniref:SDR family NAD(P)-dependent oxidoreductase n=1 Tax=Variovorax humicola TaxID=1769758 RepID=A0ABU8W4D4_9BURK